jgi:hypothetical protein
MSGTSSGCPPTPPTLPGATGSPGSGGGTSPCGGRGGQLTLPFGPGRVHAHRLAWRDASAGPTTLDTCGPPGIPSSASVRLQSLLASRLRADPAWRGGILWRLTWRRLDTPWGRRCCQLRASARRTCGPGSTGPRCGYPTTLVSEGEYQETGGKRYLKLEGAVKLLRAGWHSPTANVLQGPSGCPQDARRLVDQAICAGWSTPTAEEFCGRPEAHLARKRRIRDAGGSIGVSLTDLALQVQTLIGTTSSGSPAPMDTPGRYRVDPAFPRWLMGFPAVWDRASPDWDAWCAAQAAIALADRGDTATPSCPPWPPPG